MVNSLDGVTEITDTDINVKFGNGDVVKSCKKGIFRGTVVQENGNELQVALEVKYVPDLWCNLFSIGSAINKGWQLKNVGKKYVLTKNKNTLVFDRHSSAGDGCTMMVHIKPRPSSIEDAAAATNLDRRRMDIVDMHRLLGHAGEAKVRDMAKYLGIQLHGKMQGCEHCKVSKAQRKKIPKENFQRSSIPGERLYVDLCTIHATSAGLKKHWIIAVDDATDMKWSMFLKQKSEVGKALFEFLKLRKQDGFPVQIIRMDNSGENKRFQARAGNEGYADLKFEFTAPGTPQQNGVVERAFATLQGRVRAMMNQAGFTKELRGFLWAECARTATELENCMPDSPGQNPPIVNMYGSQYKWAHELRTFGEMAVITNTASIGHQDKLANRGKTYMFVGYPTDYPRGTYRFYNLITNKITHSRDIQWLNKTWGEYENIKSINIIRLDNEDDTPEVEEDSPDTQVEITPTDAIVEDQLALPANPENVNTPDLGGTLPRISGLQRELFNLNTSYNQTVVQEVPEPPIEMALMTAIDSGYSEPSNFKAAWHHPDPIHQEHWRAAIRKEFKDMHDKSVWKYTSTNAIPSDRKLLGSKWVFKLKKNGTYRARLVALGYSQVPGVDFTDNFAPVINDISFRIMLILYSLRGYDSRVIDVETAFLYGDLDEQIYLKIPQGLHEYTDVPEDSSLELKKSIYGLVQAARQWWKKFTDLLISTLGFVLSKVDPCLLHRKDKMGMVYICLYVDDVLMVGDSTAIEDAVKGIKSTYSIKDIGKMHEYVGCTVIPKMDKIYLTQPDLISKMERTFLTEISKFRTYATPSGPGEIVVRPTEEDKVSESQQKQFRSGVGMLLYLLKHSRPDLGNCVRELAKVMDGAAPAHLKTLFRTIKYVIDTRNKCLVLKPTGNPEEEFILRGLCDSDYAGDRDTRRSVSGYVVYLNDALIAWKSKGQRQVTLSSTEAEYVAIADICIELIFVKMLIESLGLRVKLPIQVQGDNIGAIFLAGNSTSGQRTRHIDIRYHFVRELVEEGIINISFVKTLENDADVYTKNLSADLFNKHTEKYMEQLNDVEASMKQGG
jgi:transposase InsO family protein